MLTPAVARDPSVPSAFPLGLPFGVPGRFIDYALQAERERRLADALASRRFAVRERFGAHLGAALGRQGVVPVATPAPRFDPVPLDRLPAWDADALLDPVLEEFGFAASTPEGPFVPFAVGLIRLRGRDGRVLREERVAVNVVRPPSLTFVVGPQEPRFGRDVPFHEEADRAAAGVDAALRSLAREIAARVR
ncbi:MAG: hypothetical protein SNJ73_02400 [Acetobacteraceae bacterium]